MCFLIRKKNHIIYYNPFDIKNIKTMDYLNFFIVSILKLKSHIILVR